MKLSVTTDYAKDTGDPSVYLRRIAATGFSHVHWCHQWNTDYLYSGSEIEQIKKWLTDYGLQLLDLHGSIGPEKNWVSPQEYQRQAGVELVQNRIEMTAKLGGEVVIMHVADQSKNLPLHKSLAQLEPIARANGVRFAIENNTDNFDFIARLLPEYPADYLGLCYDSGHGNISGTGLEYLELLKDRLISVHLNDNNGCSDQHLPPFSGRVGWRRLANIIAASAYTKPLSLEISMRYTETKDEKIYLQQAFDAGAHLTQMIAEARAVF